jgi:hypothetical protein
MVSYTLLIKKKLKKHFKASRNQIEPELLKKLKPVEVRTNESTNNKINGW